MVWLRFADESRVHAGFSTLVVILQTLFSPVFAAWLAEAWLIDAALAKVGKNGWGRLG